MEHQKPSVGRMVHYVGPGVLGYEHRTTCCAAVVAAVGSGTPGDEDCLLMIFSPSPTGTFFATVEHEEPAEGGQPVLSTWHWPERV